MKEIIEAILNHLELKRVSYGDVRHVCEQEEAVAVKNGVPESIVQSQSQGFGVRVLVDGAWGFAGSSLVTAATAAELADRAIAIAKASARVKPEDMVLARNQAVKGSYVSPYVRDPFAVSLDDKLAVLLAADSALRGRGGVNIAQSFYHAFKTDKIFASTAGAWLNQRIVECGGGIAATCISDQGELQVRSYPNSFRGNFATAGYEYFEGLKIAAAAERVASEARALLAAPQCPAGKTTLVLDGSQLALQVHESIGHAIELDRIFGMEASYAGTSFLSPADRGVLRYGSPIVNVVADATVPGGLGSFGYDDEGVPAQRTDIIKDGILRGFLMSRETASILGLASNACMRADGWSRIPLVRMTNINLLPGLHSFDRLISEVDSGIYMSTNRSWSIDDKRLNFQFGTEIAWEIKNGKLGRMFKNPTYTGITPRFWNSCDAICGPAHWHMWGTPNCGKGQPSQTAHVGHGTAPARFRNVETGVMK
jgi:TldD protein